MLIDILKHFNVQIFALNPSEPSCFSKPEINSTINVCICCAMPHFFLGRSACVAGIFLRGMHTRIFLRDLPAVGGSLVGNGCEVGACLLRVLGCVLRIRRGRYTKAVVVDRLVTLGNRVCKLILVRKELSCCFHCLQHFNRYVVKMHSSHS